MTHKICLKICLNWHSINESEIKVKLNFDNFSDRNYCFDAMRLISFTTLG